MIVAGEDVARFVSGALGFGLCPPYTAMGIARDGRIIAGILFNHFEGTDVHVTAAGTGWTRGFLREAGRYAFDTLDCLRVTVVTESREVAALACRLGGRIEGRLRSHFGHERDGIVVGILRCEFVYCRLHPSTRD